MKLQIALTLLALSASSFASVKIEEELFLPKQRPEVVRDLVRTGSVEIDHVTREGFELYGSRGLSKYLDSKNIFYINMKDQKKLRLVDYPSSAQIASKLKSLATKYSKIMKLTSIGKSNKGNDLWVMKISDNVGTDEVEPEFKYISSMHGDEITGRELTVSLIEEIGQKYNSKNMDITTLVNNTEIYIMPSMNPDGSDLRQRGNAKNVDLNRNFPDITRDSQSSYSGREVEVQHVMKFQAERQFSLSANFHGGTIVANYPWDSKYDLHPLDAFVKELSTEYAELNPEMRSSDEFKNGVTNGAAWYVVKGGMQDWSYTWFNDLQITVELSHDKWPEYSEIPGFYKSNRDSMIKYLSDIHRGAGFKIARQNVSGTVAIKQTRPGNKNLGSFAFKSSEFYKVMPEGEYSFTITEKGKSAKSIINVTVEKDLVSPNGNYVVVD
jgi:hypothetical protein